jgi:arginyl-tRNA synthetase
MLLSDIKRLLKIPDNIKVEESKFGDVAIINANFKVPESQFIKRIEVIGNYTNVYLDYSKLWKELNSPLDFKSNERVLIEHTSVNPNKALHVGHLRNVYLGDFIFRALKLNGAEVKVINFIEDTGAQMSDIILAKQIGIPFEAEKFDKACSHAYVEVNKQLNNDDHLKELRSQIIRRIDSGDKEMLNLVKEISRAVLKAQLETILPQHIKYDYLVTESYILTQGLLSKVEAEGLARGIFKLENEGKNKGCLVISDKPNIIFKRSDGTALYPMKDVAFALWKLGYLSNVAHWLQFAKNWDDSPILISDEEGEIKELGKFDRTIVLVDSRQTDEQKIVKEVVEKFTNARYEFFTYEPVALSQATALKLGIDTKGEKILQMSGRKGIEVLADDLVEKVKEKIGGENKDLLAFNVVKYELLKTSPNKMIVFDLDSATQIKGNTGLYVTYTLARMKHIIEKASKTPIFSDLDAAEELALRSILFWKQKVHDAINSLNPAGLIDFLYKASSAFNEFYEHNRVIGHEREAQRLALVKTFLFVFRNVFDLLGLIEVDKV